MGSFNFLNALLNMPIVPENKMLYLYIKCIFNVYICSYF